MKYGEEAIKTFDIHATENWWPNRHKKSYTINIELPEFMCRCPRSGYPDFAALKLSYSPDKLVIELKALKLYINTFIDRYIAHEDSANEIFDMLFDKLKPHWMRLEADFNPRGNVHTVIVIDSRDLPSAGRDA